MRTKVVVHDVGMKPNCRGSSDLSNIGFSSLSMIKPSATFDGIDFNEIGLRSLLKSVA